MTIRDIEDFEDDNISPEENEEIWGEAANLSDSEDLDGGLFESTVDAYTYLIENETDPRRIDMLKQLLEEYLEENK